MELLAIVVIIALGALGAVILLQTRAKGRWGLNFGRMHCPRCGAALPFVRKPASMEETLWGGWTCQRCGCKVDKYGRERAA